MTWVHGCEVGLRFTGLKYKVSSICQDLKVKKGQQNDILELPLCLLAVEGEVTRDLENISQEELEELADSEAQPQS